MQRRTRRDFIGGAVREVVFGLEDSLVSTLGAVSGIAVGSGDRYVVILSGLVLVAVEAVSMAAGSFLSSKSAAEVAKERERQDHARMLQERVSDDESLAEMLKRKKFSAGEVKTVLNALGRERKLWLREVARNEYRFHANLGLSPVASAVVMGLSYLIGGILVFTPYFFAPIGIAGPLTVAIGVGAMFGLGIWKAAVADVPKMRSGLEMVVISLVAAGLGIAIGRIMSSML